MATSRLIGDAERVEERCDLRRSGMERWRLGHGDIAFTDDMVKSISSNYVSTRLTSSPALQLRWWDEPYAGV